MFKPFIGDCKNPECGRTGVIIPVRRGICQYCNHEEKQKLKRVKIDVEKQFNGTGKNISLSIHFPSKQKGKKIQNARKRTGEAEVFAEIAEEREWVCFVSGKSLMELTATQFMHVLPKALNKYPLFKLYKPNIQLASNEIHYAWDFVPRSELRKDRRFDKLFELEEQLKQEYKLLKSSL